MISLHHTVGNAQHSRSWTGNPLTWTDRDQRQWNVTLEWSHEQGAPRPIGLTLSLVEQPGTITSALMREIPIGELARFDLNNNGARQPRATRAGESTVKGTGPQRGTPLDQKALETVAHLYREALRTGKPPAATVAAALNIAPSTAAKRIMAARRQNLLGPTAPGRKGETR